MCIRDRPHGEKSVKGANDMKKVLSVLALTLCAALLLAACGGAKLPEGMDQDAVDQAVEQSIRLLDAKDYAGLMDTMTDEMKAAADEACLLYTSRCV